MLREFIDWKMALLLSVMCCASYFDPLYGILALKFVALSASIGWPHLVASLYLRQQNRLLDRIKAIYAVGLSTFSAGDKDAATALLQSLRADEQKWKRRNGDWFKTGLFAFMVVSNLLLAFIYVYAPQMWLMYRYPTKGGMMAEIANDFQKLPLFYWALLAVAVLLLGLWPVSTMGKKSLNSYRWAEHYGDQLAQILRAGRRLVAAPHRRNGGALKAGNARELLGLGPYFTSAELRRAWLGLVRELHPDSWANAPAAVRRAKEEALKRINAAKDELEGKLS